MGLPNKFEITRNIAQCYHSDVYSVRDRDAQKWYIAKSVRDKPDSLHQGVNPRITFKREMEILTSLDHQCIPKPLAVHNEGFALFETMGGSTLLDALSNKKPFSITEVLEYSLQLLDAIDYIHRRGLLLNSLHPGTVFLRTDKTILFLEFAFCVPNDRITKPGEHMISRMLPYTTPEHLGILDVPIDIRSDLFCGGLLLYHLFHGSVPFCTDSIDAFIHSVMRSEPDPIAGIPRFLNKILLKALKPSPHDRYQTAIGFRYDLQYALRLIRDNDMPEGMEPGMVDAVTAVNDATFFIGRHKESELLHRYLDRLMERKNGSASLIYGPSGIGKTEIVHQLRRTANHETIIWLSTKCNRHTSNHPYAAIRNLVLELIALIVQANQEVQDRFGNTLHTLLDESGILCRIIPELKPFFSEVRDIGEVEKEKEAGRVHYVLGRLLERLCDVGNMVFFVDDFQWIDKVSFHLFHTVLAGRLPCMVIAGFRTPDSDTLPMVHGTQLPDLEFDIKISVQPFTCEEIETMIRSGVGDVSGAGTLAALLHEKTDCYPITIREALRYLVNEKILANDTGDWLLDYGRLADLPHRFDYPSLIMRKHDQLLDGEWTFLELSSLVEGSFDRELIEAFGRFGSSETETMAQRLEMLGFIYCRHDGVMAFTHDKIKDAINSGIPETRKSELFEDLGGLYRKRTENDRTVLFKSAECYVRSTDYSMTIRVCVDAGMYATECIAFDLAIRYFERALECIGIISGKGDPPPVDKQYVKELLAGVFMLIGRNEDAVEMYKEILDARPDASKEKSMELMYRIGTLYHNMGNFIQSSDWFFKALKKVGVLFPKTKAGLLFGLVKEVLKIILNTCFSRWLPRKKSGALEYVITRIYTMLDYTLFFQDVSYSMLAHLRGRNLAYSLEDCHEKAVAVSHFSIATNIMFLKKTGFNAAEGSIDIARRINRKDTLSTVQSTSGIFFFLQGKWKRALQCFNGAIKNSKEYGDSWGQITPLEHISYITLYNGELGECFDASMMLEKFGCECSDKRALAIAERNYCLLDVITKGQYRSSTGENYLQLGKFDNFLVKTANEIVEANIKLLLGDRLSAFNLCKNALKTIQEKYLFFEYVTAVYQVYCETLISEMLYRKLHENVIPLEDKNILKEMRNKLFIGLIRSKINPAHRGAIFRCLAWYYAFKSHPKKANKYFLKAIEKHHELGMRYEEGKSYREYGFFLEDCYLPGKARDMLNEAYRIFSRCGAYYECKRIETKVDEPVIAEEKNRAQNPKPITSEQIGIHSETTLLSMLLTSLTKTSNAIWEIEKIDTLLRQIVQNMIGVTGAQYGGLVLESDDALENRIIFIDHNGAFLRDVSNDDEKTLIEKVRQERALIVVNSREQNAVFTGSMLCVPLNRGNTYNGCVILVNDRASGLFSDNIRSVIQVLSTQAAVLLENARLIEKYRDISRSLEKRVLEQTKDLQKKKEEQQNMNLKLIESESMRTLLNNTLVHDIKNNIFSISAGTRTLAMDIGQAIDDRAKQKIDNINATCAEIYKLAVDVLDISKLEDGEMVVEKRTIDGTVLYSVLQRCIDTLPFEEKGQCVHIDQNVEDFCIFADNRLLERVLYNLLSNAHKYTPDNGSIEIRCKRSGNENGISLYNSGMPLSNDKTKRIFEKYYGVGINYSRHSTGLGLYFCKLVMHAHRGSIQVEPVSDGNWFHLRFPGRE